MKRLVLWLGMFLILVFMFIFPDSANALDINSSILNDLESHLSSNYSGTTCSNVTLFQMGANDYTWYLCTDQYQNLQATINTNLIDGSRFTNLKSNFYGIESLKVCWISGSCGTARFSGSGYYNPNTNTWVQSCNGSSCPYSQSIPESATYHNGYIFGVFNRLGNNSNYNIIYQNANSQLFYNNYNLLYYDTPLNYFGSYTNTFSQPDNVKGSLLDFSGDELTASILDFSYSYINSYMYDFTTIDNEDTLISHQYNYLSPDLTGNYKLGFIITKKTYNDVPVVVHAVTNTGTWACNSITPLKNQNDYNYQFYVECPSVNFSDTDDDYLKIVVNGSSEYYQITGPFTWYDTNYLFQNSNNNKYVGISSILRNPTDTPPVPVTPDEPTPDDTIDAINNINDSINNSNVDDFNDSFSSFNNSIASNSVISDLLLLPINMLQNIVSSINGICTPFNLGTIKGNTITLPCIDLQSILGNGIWTFIDIISCGLFVLVIRKRMVDIFNDLSSLKDRGNVLE